MNTQIKILSSHLNYGKCRRMIQWLKETYYLSDNEAEIVNNIDEILNYITWIFSNLVSNNKGDWNRLPEPVEKMNELLILNK